MSTSSTNVLQSLGSIGPGTGAIKITPYVEYVGIALGDNAHDQYQTISAQTECRNFSLEELRLADYKHGRAGEGTGSRARFSFSPFVGSSNKVLLCNTKRSKAHLDLMRGPGIEICVGTSTPPCTATETCGTWSLPKSLISHYSPFLKSACEREFQERIENRINLPEDDARAFALFVEWMYYGDYTVSPPSSKEEENVSIDARCWVLGDKFLCTGFKNLAMSRLHAQHTSIFGCTSVTTHDVLHAFQNSGEKSKLRLFYLDFVVEHFSHSKRLMGTTEEFDELLLGSRDLRLSFIESFRKSFNERMIVGNQEVYLEKDVDLSSVLGEMKITEPLEQ